MKKKKKGLLILAVISLILGSVLVFLGINYLSKPNVLPSQATLHSTQRPT